MSTTPDIKLGKYRRIANGKLLWVVEILDGDRLRVRAGRGASGAFFRTSVRTATRFLDQYEKDED